jgi:hypothetical protein
MKISFRHQPLVVEYPDATQTGRAGSRQLTMLREVLPVSSSSIIRDGNGHSVSEMRRGGEVCDRI